MFLGFLGFLGFRAVSLGASSSFKLFLKERGFSKKAIRIREIIGLVSLGFKFRV